MSNNCRKNRQIARQLFLIGLGILFPSSTVFAQPIIPANDGTNTVVIPNGNRSDISGGQTSGDRANLFHSFQRFNLDSGQIANFISQPEIQNILVRVGGETSIINGILQITGGNSNLYLINPAGIIFGQNASLNLPASFIATTSSNIAFGVNQFHSIGSNNYELLVNYPTALILSESKTGTIINNGNLAVKPGQNLTILGSNVINNGTLSAPVGNITVTGIPGENLVRINQQGQMLSLEVTPIIQNHQSAEVNLLSLPKLLTGGNQNHATGLEIKGNNIVLTENINSKFRTASRETSGRQPPLPPPVYLPPIAEISQLNNLRPPIPKRGDFPPPTNHPPVPQIITTEVSQSNNSTPPTPLNTTPSLVFQSTAEVSKSNNVTPLNTTPSLVFESQFANNINAPSPPSQILNLNTEGMNNLIIPNQGNQTIPNPVIPPFPVAEARPFLVGSNNPAIFNEARVNNSQNQMRIGGNISLNSALPVILEKQITNEYEMAWEKKLSDSAIAETTVKEMLGKIEAKTGQKSAVIYALAYPEKLRENQEGSQFPSQGGLTLMLVPSNGAPIIKQIAEVDERKLRRTVKEFRMEVSDPKTTAWPAAEQLYQWIIAPLEPYLQEAGIDTLLFCLDEGLRSIPLAALYDGKKFLVEKYSLSLIPSVSLTNASYQGLQDAKVLAMGMSEFTDPNQSDLVNVPVEISTIVGELWPGKSFLNEAFTFDNLKAARTQQAYEIIHLATHADFKSRRNSYIQFWEQKLPLDGLRDLQWYKQPQVELLVLSGCKTAIGNPDEAEAEFGFAGLAVRAGVKSALASLWYVSDVGTLGLMVEFYQNLKSSSIKAEALRQAQLAMLKGRVQVEGGVLRGTARDVSLSRSLVGTVDGEDFSHPYYWAGFTMVGSPW